MGAQIDLAKQRYNQWLQDENIDQGTKLELEGIKDDELEVYDRFYRDLTFGTGGLRGVMGAGTNRMNSYTVGKAAQGLANWILAKGLTAPSAVVAHDSRHNSPQFSLDTALVLAANGITTYLFKSLRPTPQLSYTVRYLQASLGAVITASHNPPEYNGFKAYDETGCQLSPEAADEAIAEIAKLTFSEVKKMEQVIAEQQGLLVWLDEVTDDAYTSEVTKQSLFELGDESDDFKVVFTALHGAGNYPVRAALQKIGVKHVYIVSEQEQPDGAFPTVTSPNPEEKAAFELAVTLAKSVQADIVIGTDPDADRMGALVKSSMGEYEVLSGNQAGAIILHYVLSRMQEQDTLPKNGVVIKTIVTSELGAVVAESFGMKVENTLTGFKYIGEKMNQYEANKEQTFVFGYEESYGYLVGQYARDKDAVVAAMLICEAAAYYRTQNKTLYDVLQTLYEQHGYYMESQHARTLKGAEGVHKINTIMSHFRQHSPIQIADIKVEKVSDYELGLDGLRVENVLKYTLADGSWFCLRPSGTEPKIKVYFGVKGQTETLAITTLTRIADEIMAMVDRI